MTATGIANVVGKVVACQACGVSTLAMHWPLPRPACGKSLEGGALWPGHGGGRDTAGDTRDARRKAAAILTIWARRLEFLEALVFSDDFGSDDSRAVARGVLDRLKTDLSTERSTLQKFADRLHPAMAELYAPAIRRVLDTLSVRINSRDIEAWRCCVFAAVGEISYHISEIP